MRLEARTIELDDLKRELHIAYILEAYGHQPAGESSGRLHYHSPWRKDSNPSLDVFVNDQGVQRAGDWAEGFNGSVLDVVGRFEETQDFKEIVAVARQHYSDMLEAGWEGPTFSGGQDRSMNEEVVTRLLASPQVGTVPGNEALYELLTSNQGVTADVVAAYGVLQDGDRLIIPYPENRAIRIRWADGSKTFVEGGRPGLYHLPELDEDDPRPIVLVEGESDCWAATAALGAGVQVISTPGVGHQPSRYVDRLHGRPVAITFDGDKAGRDGAMKWATTLTEAGSTVSIVPMPNGKDVASMSHAEFRRLHALRRTWVKNNSGMRAGDTGYEVDGVKEPRTVSNWIARPVRLLAYDDGRPRTYEVEVTVSGQVITDRTFMLTADDVRSSASLHRWTAQFSGSWWGGQLDHQRLRAVIEEQATFLPIDSATSNPGLIGTSFVFPGGTVGDSSTVCLPDPQSPMSDPGVFDLRYHRDAGPDTLRKFLAMHRSTVVQPVLAWFAIAPLRSLYEQFPPLFVTGSSGSGKTTLCEEVLRMFSGVSMVTNLTSTTPYALSLTMGSTNAFPTWFDEYRPGAKKTTMDIMNQLLRDAFNRAPSRRGGMGSDPSKITVINTGNPLLVSGEDFADEVSHRDRLVKVFVPIEGKGALPMWEAPDFGFARDYLDWLTDRTNGLASPVENPPVIRSGAYEDEGVTPRQAYNLAVLDAGWSLLRAYVSERGASFTLSAADWSGLLAQAQEEASNDPVLDQLRSLLEQGPSNALWMDEDGLLYVSSSQVLTELKRAGYGLPFTSARAMTMYLTDRLKGERQTRTGLAGATKTRYVVLPNPWADEVASTS